MTHKKPGYPIAVVVDEFPSLPETFILREIEALQDAGLNPRLYALRAGNASVLHARAHRWIAQIRYLSSPASSSGGQADRRQQTRGDPVAWRCLLTLMARTGLRFPGLFVRILRHRHAVAALARAVDEDHIGYIHAHFATLPTEIAWAASIYSGCPFGFSTHAHDIFTQSPALLRYKIAQAVFISGCTETHTRFLRKLVPPPIQSRIQRFYHGVPIPVHDPPRSPQPGRIMAVGRLVPKKAFDTLLAACAILSKRGIDYTCELVGEGPEKQPLTKRIHDSGLEKNVVMTGAVTQEQLPQYYRRAMLVVVTSRILPNGDRDGIPNVLLEAMARGAPVIATDTPSIREVVRHNLNGWLIPPDHPETLADAIQKLLADGNLRDQFSRQAASTIRQHFDAEQHARDLVEFYRSFL